MWFQRPKSVLPTTLPDMNVSRKKNWTFLELFFKILMPLIKNNINVNKNKNCKISKTACNSNYTFQKIPFCFLCSICFLLFSYHVWPITKGVYIWHTRPGRPLDQWRCCDRLPQNWQSLLSCKNFAPQKRKKYISRNCRLLIYLYNNPNKMKVTNETMVQKC